MSDKKRFLRDHLIDDMLSEVRLVSDKVGDSDFPRMIFSQSLSSLSEMYETNKVVPQHLEDIIDLLKKQADTKDVIQHAVEAAAHVQLGLVAVHGALKDDMNVISGSVQSLRESLGITEE